MAVQLPVGVVETHVILRAMIRCSRDVTCENYQSVAAMVLCPGPGRRQYRHVIQRSCEGSHTGFRRTLPIRKKFSGSRLAFIMT